MKIFLSRPPVSSAGSSTGQEEEFSLQASSFLCWKLGWAGRIALPGLLETNNQENLLHQAFSKTKMKDGSTTPPLDQNRRIAPVKSDHSGTPAGQDHISLRFLLSSYEKLLLLGSSWSGPDFIDFH